MKLKLPITFTQLIWLMPLSTLLLVGVAGWGYLHHQPLLFKPIIALGIAGAALSISVHVGLLHLFLKCPTCGSFGELTFAYQSGRSKPRPLFDCPHCGRLVNKSQLAISVQPEALSVCPHCGYELQPQESTCPHCPQPKQSPHHPLKKGDADH